MTAPKTSKPNWFMQTLGSTLGRKLLMALSGLFLILFLTIHLLGNLKLLIPDNGKSFNEYAHFMAHNELIKAVSVLNLVLILTHVIVSLMLTFQNKKARPVGYAYSSKTKISPAARQMMVLGTLILVFIAMHLVNFWAVAKFGTMPKSADGMPDLYAVTREAFKIEWLVGFYAISMLVLGFHLSHGFQSAFQSLGLNHKKYTPFIKGLGLVYSIVVPALFALIPIWMYIAQLK